MKRLHDFGFRAVIANTKLPLLSLQAIKGLKAENDTLKQQLTEQWNEIVTLKKKVVQIEVLMRVVCQAVPNVVCLLSRCFQLRSGILRYRLL